MSQRYVRISSFPENLYVNNAPVLISAGALLKDNKTGKVLAQFKFRNLSKNIITAVKLSIRAYDISGVELAGVEEYQYLDISVKPNESFGDDKAIVLPDTNTRNCTVIIKEVVFASIAPWRNDDLTGCDPIPVQVPLAEALNSSGLVEQYKRDTTEHSRYKPAKYLDLWLCSCGTANKHHSQKCSHCGIERNRLLEATNLERLEHNYKIYQNRQAEEYKAQQESRNRKRKIAVIAAVCVLVLLAVALFINNYIIPSMKYNAADALLTQGKYEEAKAEFEALGGFKDSQERVQDVMDAQQIAIAESIAAEEAAEMARIEAQKAADYIKAEEMLNGRHFDAAIYGFEALGDYKDASDRLQEAKYQKSKLLLSMDSYDEAYLLLSSIVEYKDSYEVMAESKYSRALEFIDSEAYVNAKALLDEIPDYKNVSSLLENFHYRIASVTGYYGSKYTFSYEFDESGNLVTVYVQYRTSNYNLEENKGYSCDAEFTVENNRPISSVDYENTGFYKDVYIVASTSEPKIVNSTYTYENDKLIITQTGRKTRTGEVLKYNPKECEIVTLSNGSTQVSKVQGAEEYCIINEYGQFERHSKDHTNTYEWELVYDQNHLDGLDYLYVYLTI